MSISGSSSSFKISDSTEFDDMNSITSSSCETISLAAEVRERGLATELLLEPAPEQVLGRESISRETALSSSGALMLANNLEAFTVEGDENDEEGVSEQTLEATSCALLIVEETKSASRKHIALAAGRLSFVREDSTTRLASRNLSIVVSAVNEEGEERERVEDWVLKKKRGWLCVYGGHSKIKFSGCKFSLLYLRSIIYNF